MLLWGSSLTKPHMRSFSVMWYDTSVILTLTYNIVWIIREAKEDQPPWPVNSRDTALSFLYDISTVLIFSLIYSILFSTNIVERTEKKRRRHQCYYLFIIMLLLIVVHWHCSKHSWSVAFWLVKNCFCRFLHVYEVHRWLNIHVIVRIW